MVWSTGVFALLPTILPYSHCAAGRSILMRRTRADHHGQCAYRVGHRDCLPNAHTSSGTADDIFFPSIYDTKSMACSARCKYPPVPIRRSRRESELDVWDKTRGTVWSVKTTLPGSWRGTLPTAHLVLYRVQGVCDVPHSVDSRQNVSRLLVCCSFPLSKARDALSAHLQ
jgi:hypothetical protein